MSRLQMLTVLHPDPLTAGGISRIWGQAYQVNIASYVGKEINSFNAKFVDVDGMGCCVAHLHLLTPGSSYCLLVSQSASATFCSAANSSGACVF